jgi:choline/glycine/proline betaine transport protein
MPGQSNPRMCRPVSSSDADPNSTDDPTQVTPAGPGRSVPPRTTKGSFVSTIYPRVFIPAALLILAFVVFGAVATETLSNAIFAIRDNIVGGLGWYYVAIVAGFVIFAIVVGVSRLGDIRLGKDDERPDFSLGAWLAMLFAAGMGIGLVFFGVAEPLWHLAAPKPGVDGTPEELGQAAMTQTLLHWGVHAWAIYVVVGLAISYAVYRKGRPVSIRWALEPLLGDRVKGWLGDLIDVLAILGTVFGVATSLGIGASQIGGGLVFLGLADDAPDTDTGVPANTVLVLTIVLITLVATFSVVSGLRRGIKWLSQANVTIAGGVALFVAIAGPTLFILREFVESIGRYLQNFVSLTFDVTAFHSEAGEVWQAGWTIFYWGWWMSWAPFVGVFVARISRGRTVREFVLGLLVVPTLVTFGWFAIMGGSAIYHELFSGDDPIDIESTGSNTALFALLDTFPGGRGMIVVTIVLIALFFVTSSDSASLVVDMLASGGDPNPPTWSRIFWSSVEGAVAIVLLLAGGLEALQIGAVSLALPFSVVMVLMVFATWRALRADHLATLEVMRRQRQAALAARVTESFGDSVATAVAEQGPPAYLEGHEEREWTSWWQRLVDRLKARPGGLP